MTQTHPVLTCCIMKSLSPKVEQVLLYDMRSVTQLPGMEEGGAYASWLYGYNGSRWSSRLCWRGPEGQSVYCPNNVCPAQMLELQRQGSQKQWQSSRHCGQPACRSSHGMDPCEFSERFREWANVMDRWYMSKQFFFQIENYIFGVIHKRDMGYLDEIRQI